MNVISLSLSLSTRKGKVFKNLDGSLRYRDTDSEREALLCILSGVLTFNNLGVPLRV